MKRSFICRIEGFSENDVSRGGVGIFVQGVKERISEVAGVPIEEVRLYMSQDVRFRTEPDGIFCELIVPKSSMITPEQFEKDLEKYIGINSQVYAHY